MAPGISHSRFTHPIDSERPKGASRFEFLAPKLKRRVTLFDPFHVRLWALLESNPRVLRYCERPAYWHHDNRRQLADFWVKIGRREVCWIVTPTPQPARAGDLSADDDIGVRYVHVQDLAAHGVWIENWRLCRVSRQQGDRVNCDARTLDESTCSISKGCVS